MQAAHQQSWDPWGWGAFSDSCSSALKTSLSETRLGTEGGDARCPFLALLTDPGLLSLPITLPPTIRPQVSSSPNSLCLGQPQPQSKEPVLSPKWVSSERLFYSRPLRINLLLHLINLNCCCAERNKMERKISCLHFREWGTPGGLPPPGLLPEALGSGCTLPHFPATSLLCSHNKPPATLHESSKRGGTGFLSLLTSSSRA